MAECVNDKNKNICIFRDIFELSNFACLRWKEIAENAIFEKNKFVVALSGGKTPFIFYKELSLKIENSLWQKTHVFLVDERFVPLNHAASNYRFIIENLGKKQIYTVDTTLNCAEKSAIEYERKIKEFFGLKKEQIPRFDLVILGIGKDGHIASLFPRTVLQKRGRLVILTSDEYERVTMTFSVINNAKNIFFVVTGKNKSEIVKKVILKENKKLPAVKVNPKDGNLFFLLDEEAYSNL